MNETKVMAVGRFTNGARLVMPLKTSAEEFERVGGCPLKRCMKLVGYWRPEWVPDIRVQERP
jgi:hypothetical protein